MGKVYIKKEKSKVIDGHKRCSKCCEMLPVDNFRENLKIKTGLHSRCKSCDKTYVKKLPPSDVVNGHKMCLKCNELLPVNMFRENSKVKSGLHSYCVECTIIPKKVKEPKVIIPKKVKEPKVIIPKKVKEPKVIIPKKVKPPRIVDGKCICSTCKESLPVTNFHKKSNTKDGISYTCKVCTLSSKKKNTESYKESRRKYRQNKRDKDRVIREEKKQLKKNELELLKIQKKNIRLDTLEKNKLEKQRIAEEKKLEKIRIKEEYLNSEEYQERQRLIKERKRVSSLKKYNRRMEEPLFKFKKLLSNNIRNSFKRGGFSKTSRACEILGADWDVVKNYFENKFKPGMDWENMGLWHIDHILPISTANCEEDIIRLNHYTNLQPLWADENIKKSDKLTTESYLKQTFPYSEIRSDYEVNLVEVKIDNNKGIGFFGKNI